MQRRRQAWLGALGLLVITMAGACGNASTAAPALPGSPVCAPACAPGQVCEQGVCIADGGPCDTPDACSNDSTCVDGRCVPWATLPESRDPSCAVPFDPLARIEPVVQCRWPGDQVIPKPASFKVWMTPVVGELVPGNGTPEVAFISFGVDRKGTVRVIRGDDCTTLWTGDVLAGTNYWDELALGDVDGDGLNELCYRNADSVPVCVHGADGRLKWAGHDGANQPVTTNHRFPAIANVDGQGTAELVFGAMVFSGADGTQRPGANIGVNSQYISGALGDVDGDGTLEAMYGNGILDLADGGFEAWPQGTAGFTAIGDLYRDIAGPEAVVVTTGQLRVHASSGDLLHSFTLPTSAGGAPTIADLDGDGEAEFATLGQSRYIAYDLDCLQTPASARQGQCPTDNARTRGNGVLWQQSIQETSSGVTGSTVFDLEGDGAVEVVYADECWARIFDGITGTVKVSLPHVSGTAYEYPVIADTNGDFFTEIVLAQGTWSTISCPGSDPLPSNPDVFAVARSAADRYEGIVIYADRTGRWAPSEPQWSEYNESFT
ncbi:MAG: EB domain-containing protein, partial [Polyangiales bacterium]